jgi:transposase
MSFKKVYDAEFKANTIQLILKNKMSVVDASRDLGVGKSTLQRWLRDHRIVNSSSQTLNTSAPHHSPVLSQDMRQLKRENEILRQERDILKKALCIFSQTSKEGFPL